jgi:hypothetical protein
MMNTIKQEALLDSSAKTTIELVPKQHDFGNITHTQTLKGLFLLKTQG